VPFFEILKIRLRFSSFDRTNGASPTRERRRRLLWASSKYIMSCQIVCAPASELLEAPFVFVVFYSGAKIERLNKTHVLSSNLEK